MNEYTKKVKKKTLILLQIMTSRGERTFKKG